MKKTRKRKSKMNREKDRIEKLKKSYTADSSDSKEINEAFEKIQSWTDD